MGARGVPESAAEVLAAVDFTWERLEKLAWKALGDGMRRRGISLDEDRLRRAHELYVDVGVEWARRYDPALSGGRSFSSSAYDRMLPRVADFLRKEHGDERRGTPLMQVPTDVMPDGPRVDEETFEQLVEEVSGSLTTRALHTLHTVGYDKFVLGLTRAEIRVKRGLPAGEVSELLEEVGWQLQTTLRRAA